MNPENKELKKRRPRWMRFSLRTGLILMTVLCFWMARSASQVRRQNHAIEKIRELGGDVFFAHGFDSQKTPHMNPGTWVPDWVTNAVTEPYLRKVVTVNFAWPSKDAQTNHTFDVRDEDLVLLRDTPYVRELLLRRNRNISDEGLVFASRLKNLRVLTLNGTSVTGPGLRHIAHLHTLVGLDLADTPLTDKGLVHLKNLKNLEWLILNNTEITDQGLSHLSSLQSLTGLQLSSTNITDAGLKHLKHLKSLTRVSLGGTNVTDQGRSELSKSLPKCRI